MNHEQEVLMSFIKLHGHKAKINKNERCIHLVNYSASGIPLHSSLTIYNMDEMLTNYDLNSKLVQWVLNQMNTYDIDKEVILGIVFSNSNILAHVVKLIRDDD